MSDYYDGLIVQATAHDADNGKLLHTFPLQYQHEALEAMVFGGSALAYYINEVYKHYGCTPETAGHIEELLDWERNLHIYSWAPLNFDFNIKED